MIRRMVAVTLGAFALTALVAGPAAAQNKCAGSKIKAAGKKAACLLGLDAKSAAKAAPIDPLKVQKCLDKYTTAFAKAEGKPPCLTTGDVAAIEAKVDAFRADVVSELAGAHPNKCEGSKLKAAGKKASCLLSLRAKVAAKGGALDPLKVQKCLDKFSTAFSKAEAKPPCNTTGDAAAIEAKVDALVDDIDGEANPPPTTTTTVVTTTTTVLVTTTTTLACNCCSALPSLLSFTTAAAGGGSTGTVSPAVCVQGTNNGTSCATDATCTGGGVCRGHLDKGGLYFGSGQPAGINLPANIPDLSTSYTKIASCSSGNPVLTATVSGDIPAGCSVPGGTPAQGLRHCTAAGCLFGSPLPIPNFANPPTSTCIINEVATNATGSATCATGDTNLNLPLTSHVYLTGSVLGTQTCALCVGGTVGVCGSGTCSGGTRNTLACTPETNSLTSHDCPQPAGTFIGDLPIPFNLTTGSQTKTSFATGAQPRVICGFCFDPNVSSAFENPPHACSSDAQCTTGFFDSCRQHNNGAFRNPFATTVTETGSSPSACIGTGTPQPTTLASVFCIPPSYDPIVDPSGELPGPGAVSLPGTAQFLP
jgi:hypothetical protein